LTLNFAIPAKHHMYCQFREENIGLNSSTYSLHQANIPPLFLAPNHSFMPRNYEIAGFSLFPVSHIIVLGLESVTRPRKGVGISQVVACCQQSGNKLVKLKR